MRMKIRIVADSSANINAMRDIDFASVPLKIIIGEKEYSDDAQIDVAEMMQTLKGHKGRTSTACAGMQEWLDAFGDADIVYVAAITSALSGSYNSACIAADEYMRQHPDRKVFVLDSLSAGPEITLVMEKYRELVLAGADYDEVCRGIREYLSRTKLMFSLESLDNFARNGRVSHATAAIVGVLGIRIVGKASDEGTLQPLHKARGEKAAVQKLVRSIYDSGYCGGKVRIAHTANRPMADTLQNMIREQYPAADVVISENRALCSYYAENGGLLIAYET